MLSLLNSAFLLGLDNCGSLDSNLSLGSSNDGVVSLTNHTSLGSANLLNSMSNDMELVSIDSNLGHMVSFHCACELVLKYVCLVFQLTRISVYLLGNIFANVSLNL